MTDAEAMAAKAKWESGNRAPKKGKGKLAKAAKAARPTVDVNADTKVIESKTRSAGSTASAAPKAGPAPKVGRTVIGGNMDIPQGDTRVFDFESKPQSKPNLSLVTNDAVTETPASGAKTQTTEAPKPQKGTLAKAAKAAKAPAPEIPGAKSSAAPEIPNRPLDGPLPRQGSMEGKPVEKITVKASEHNVKVTQEGLDKWKAGDAERRISQGSAPQAERRAALQAQKVMTPSGAVESTVPKPAPAPAAPAGPLRMTAGDLFPEVSHARGPMVAGDIGAQTGSLSVKQRAARAAGKVVAKGIKWSGTAMGKAAIAVGKSAVGPIINPVREFRAGRAARAASWEAAGPVGKAVQTAATTVKVGWAGAKTAGGLARGAAYGIAGDMGMQFSEHYGEVKAERQVEAESRKEYGEKYGLKVTSKENPSLLRMTLGGSPKIKVHDTTQDVGPDGKSLSQKRRERGEAKMAENDYNRVKKAAGRNIITGSYKPKGGSEQV